jgi:hypothetical protein
MLRQNLQNNISQKENLASGKNRNLFLFSFHVIRLLICCSLRNVVYAVCSNICAVTSKKKGWMKDLTILVQEMETRYSAQLIIAALNEAPGIGLTIGEMKDPHSG